ncbi:hypothetical protein L3X38_023011 [Prunus dulcis]|uniref:Uncharacterized protein n=1 Tax=Prunus dulcis TaxID=3755 RepID=A0AAD4VZT6_PRUDU|nr:hypothetical protein L3X38_023011 [Prunus dulcis]
MNLYSIFLLILVCHDLLPYSSLATRKLQDLEETNKVRKSSANDDFQDKQSLFEEATDHVQRKVLHEVHSGPNPIGNSIPHQHKANTSLRKTP